MGGQSLTITLLCKVSSISELCKLQIVNMNKLDLDYSSLSLKNKVLYQSTKVTPSTANSFESESPSTAHCFSHVGVNCEWNGPVLT